MAKGKWDRVVLREICDSVKYGYTASAKSEPIGPKFLRITDIMPDQIDWVSVPYCEIDDDKLNKYLLKEGDIVIARTGTPGYAKRIRADHQAVFASYLVRIRVDPKCDSQYVGYVIESAEYKQFVELNRGGAAQPHANAQILTSFPIPLPPLPIQHKIAAILSTYDDLIENNTRRIKILEDMAQTLYREWFVQYRFPGHENVPMVQSELGPIPQGWEVKMLGEMCNVLMGQSPKSEFYNKIGEGLPFHQGVTDFGSRYPTDRVYCTIQKRIAEIDDILFSVRAPVGRINIANKRIIIGRGLSAIRSKSNHQHFIIHQLKDRFQEEDTMGSGTIFNAITKADLLGIQLLKPIIHLIAKFEKTVQPISSELANLTIKNNNLRQTRDLLLPKLISGEIDVSQLDIATDEVQPNQGGTPIRYS
ncbi:restriction endonuclease subunit S [Candidatus Poribacteria bacterium]|nr:restriction endonuclease subunit S [Candidatus Poribacteria bacterium]